MKRKFLAARDDLVTRIIQIAESKNVTLFGLLNETLEQLIEAEQIGETLQQIVAQHKVTKMAREVGFVLVKEELLNDVVDKVYETDNAALHKTWTMTGQWFGRFLQTRIREQEPVNALEGTLRMLLWNATDFNIAENDGKLSLKCVGSRIPYAQTVLLSDFLIGIMNAFEYSSVKKSIDRGIISLDFVKPRQ